MQFIDYEYSACGYRLISMSRTSTSRPRKYILALLKICRLHVLRTGGTTLATISMSTLDSNAIIPVTPTRRRNGASSNITWRLAASKHRQ